MTSQISNCDRRLSRAARSILINKILPILQHYDETIDNIPLSKLSKQDKMDYYESSILSLANNPKTCLLNPKRDIYWQEETLHKVVQPRRRHPSQKLHQCGLCGKKFVSKYYLDLHLDSKHMNDHVPKESGYEICPAIELCNIIGGQSICSRKALEDEPFYAPGIHYDTNYNDHKHNLHSQSIKRTYEKDAYSKPCSISDSSIQQCHDIIETCFGGNDGLVRDLNSLLCDTQSCHHQFHSLLNSIVSVHHGYEYWDSHHDEVNSIGYFGIFLIVAVILYYGKGSLDKWTEKKFKRRKRIVMDMKKLK